MTPALLRIEVINILTELTDQ